MIDVRAPVEFALGSLPGAVNIPIMSDEERAAVGTMYKQAGREQAMALGHQLVSGAVKEARLTAWQEHLRQYPEAVLYCFRGGLRSQITQAWLRDVGVVRPLIEGGYKKARQFLLDEIEQFSQKRTVFLMLTGPTGSAKTHLLNKVSAFYPALDLEGAARHRGSAFGAWTQKQPSQIDFEHELALRMMRLQARFPQGLPLFEDESRMIGRCTLPESFFTTMRASPVLYVDESFEQRVENIFQDYVLQTAIAGGDETAALGVFASYRASLQAISRKLGGLRTAELLQDMAESEKAYLAGRDLESNKAWIAKLLSYYYDPLYTQSFERRQPRIQLRGPSVEILDYLKSFAQDVNSLKKENSV